MLCYVMLCYVMLCYRSDMKPRALPFRPLTVKRIRSLRICEGRLR